jgi:hypothetical protein
MRPRRKLYGWLRSSGEWCLGRYPPDVPTPYLKYASMQEAEDAATAGRYQVIWCGAALDTRNQMMAAVQR